VTLIVTPGAADADSYLSLAGADEMAAKEPSTDPEIIAWGKVDATDKEAFLRRATNEIDAHVATGWAPYDADQALLFPRDQLDVDGDGEPFIPRKIERATFQQAIYVARNKDVLASMNAHRASGGSVDPDAAYGVDPAAGPSIISPLAMHYLSSFRIAPKAGKRGSVGSARVSSGFRGGW